MARPEIDQIREVTGIDSFTGEYHSIQMGVATIPTSADYAVSEINRPEIITDTETNTQIAAIVKEKDLENRTKVANGWADTVVEKVFAKSFQAYDMWGKTYNPSVEPEDDKPKQKKKKEAVTAPIGPSHLDVGTITPESWKVGKAFFSLMDDTAKGYFEKTNPEIFKIFSAEAPPPATPVDESPAKEAFTPLANKEKIREEAKALVREATKFMDEDERQQFGILFPKLVDAITLNRQHITKIYEKDFLNIYKIAIDMFKYPDQISQIHIRQGVGGEQEVNARGLAYMVAGFEMMDKVGHAFATYRNWAYNHELHKMLPKDTAIEMDEWITEQIREIIGDRTKVVEEIDEATGVMMQRETPYTQRDYILELEDATNLDTATGKEIILQAWERYTGNRPTDEELAELNKKLHVTEDKPTFVIFNAANAAIAINNMDIETTIRARDNFQKMIRGYVERFHPDLVNNVIFQNDISWDNHDFDTKMQQWYFYDKIKEENGRVTKTHDRLVVYGGHHAKSGAQEKDGINSADNYGINHIAFFDDRFEVDVRTLRPFMPKIMEPIDPARNVIYLQGQPEITFGVYRKLLAEQTTITNQIAWFESRRDAIRFDYNQHAQTVLERADVLYTAYVQQGKPVDKDGNEQSYTSFIRRVINAKDFADPKIPGSISAKRFFAQQLDTDRFKKSEDPQAAWHELTKMLHIRMPEPENQENVLTELEASIQKRTNHLAAIRQFEIEWDLAAFKNDEELSAQYANRPEAKFLHFPYSKVELETKVGNIPTYYVLEGSDVSVWPHFQVPTVERYDRALNQASETFKATNDTVIVAQKAIAEIAAEYMDEGNIDVKKDKGEVIEEWQEEDAETIQDIIAYVMEYSGTKEEKGEAMLTAIRTFYKKRTDDLVAQGRNEVAAQKKAYDHILGTIKSTMEPILQDLNATVAKRTWVRDDYLILLSDINPTIGLYQAQIDELPARIKLLSDKLGGKKKIKDREAMEAMHVHLKETYEHAKKALPHEIAQAEQAYQTFLYDIFAPQTPERNDSLDAA